eukprot:2724577-Rhodomonas_salina.4
MKRSALAVPHGKLQPWRSRRAGGDQLPGCCSSTCAVTTAAPCPGSMQGRMPASMDPDRSSRPCA